MDNSQNQQKRSPLESLQEKLYQSGAEIKGRPEAPKIFEPREQASNLPITDWESEKESESMTIKKYKKRKIIMRLAFFSAFLIMAAAAYWGYIYFFQTFQKSDVSVKITGPETVESGENAKFYVSYRNRSDFDLENAILIFEWPKGTLPKDSSSLKIEKRIGNVNSGREVTTLFEGQLFGAKNNKFAVVATLKYEPSGFERAYEAKDIFESIIRETPFSIIMDMPPRAVSGNEVELFLEYQNLSETAFPDMQLKLEYPDDFIFSSAEPQTSFSNNIWDFDKISGKEIGKIKIKGILSGRENETKLFQALIGKSDKEKFINYASGQVSVVMSSTILFVYQTINGARDSIASFGDQLDYKITYRNTSDVAIPNVVISAKLDGKAIDYKSLDIKWGSFSGATNNIIWNASGVPQLALLSPGEEGEVLFSVRLKNFIDITGSGDKNSVVSSTAKVESDQIPQALRGIPIGNEDKVDVKLNTLVGFSSKGFYQSPDAPIENSGPIPPQVGQKTTYNIIWQLTNNINDIENVRVEASLPPHVTWENKISPSNYKINYEPATGKVVWDVGVLPSGTGYIFPAMQAAFQISVMPGLADVGNQLDLISKAVLGATDSFTGTILSDETDKKTTYLQEDFYIITRQGGNVVR